MTYTGVHAKGNRDRYVPLKLNIALGRVPEAADAQRARSEAVGVRLSQLLNVSFRCLPTPGCRCSVVAISARPCSAGAIVSTTNARRVAQSRAISSPSIEDTEEWYLRPLTAVTLPMARVRLGCRNVHSARRNGLNLMRTGVQHFPVTSRRHDSKHPRD